MIGFIKNSFRRRALKGVEPFNGLRQQFPQMKNLKGIGVLCKVENMADVQAFEEMVQFLRSYPCHVAADTSEPVESASNNVKLSGVVLEGKKCFKKDKGAKVAFMEFCNENGFLFLPKGSMDWKGVPYKEPLSDFYGTGLDLLVTINPTGDFTLDFIAFRSAALFVTAVRESTIVPCSLVLEPGEGAITFREYVEQLLGYLARMQQ